MKVEVAVLRFLSLTVLNMVSGRKATLNYSHWSQLRGRSAPKPCLGALSLQLSVFRRFWWDDVPWPIDTVFIFT